MPIKIEKTIKIPKALCATCVFFFFFVYVFDFKNVRRWLAKCCWLRAFRHCSCCLIFVLLIFFFNRWHSARKIAHVKPPVSKQVRTHAYTYLYIYKCILYKKGSIALIISITSAYVVLASTNIAYNRQPKTAVRLVAELSALYLSWELDAKTSLNINSKWH